MDCRFLNWIIPGIFGIIGTLTGVFVANLFQHKRERRDAFIGFYKAFTETIYYLQGGKQHPIAVIPHMIITHEIGKTIFRPYLRKRNIKSFDEAWNEYYGECKKYCDPSHPKPDQSKFDQLAQCQQELLKKLNKLLTIAERN